MVRRTAYLAYCSDVLGEGCYIRRLITGGRNGVFGRGSDRLLMWWRCPFVPRSESGVSCVGRGGCVAAVTICCCFGRGWVDARCNESVSLFHGDAVMISAAWRVDGVPAVMICCCFGRWRRPCCDDLLLLCELAASLLWWSAAIARGKSARTGGRSAGWLSSGEHGWWWLHGSMGRAAQRGCGPLGGSGDVDGSWSPAAHGSWSGGAICNRLGVVKGWFNSWLSPPML